MVVGGDVAEEVRGERGYFGGNEKRWGRGGGGGRKAQWQAGRRKYSIAGRSDQEQPGQQSPSAVVRSVT